MQSQEILSFTHPNGQRIALVQGNICDFDGDVIVNAANEDLQHAGGVARAISEAGGPAIQIESAQMGRVPTGNAVLTGPGFLPCRAVIHAIGPVMGRCGGKEDQLLVNSAWASLLLAHRCGFSGIALPAISSGIFGFPKDRCAELLVFAAAKFCEKYSQTNLNQIEFWIIDKETVGHFYAAIEAYLKGDTGEQPTQAENAPDENEGGQEAAHNALCPGCSGSRGRVVPGKHHAEGCPWRDGEVVPLAADADPFTEEPESTPEKVREILEEIRAEVQAQDVRALAGTDIGNPGGE